MAGDEYKVQNSPPQKEVRAKQIVNFHPGNPEFRHSERLKGSVDQFKLTVHL